MTDSTATRTPKPVRSSGTFTLGEGTAGATTVHRLGFGAMQITGDGVWGEPADRDECIRVLRRAVDMGVDLIDTADSYGPEVSERLIFEALHPYPDGLVIATKAGTDPSGSRPVAAGGPTRVPAPAVRAQPAPARPRADRPVPAAPDRPPGPRRRAVRPAADLVAEGKVAHVGLSQVTVAELEAARAVVPVVSVQNLFNLTNRASADVLAHCQAQGIGFIPWFPVASGGLTGPDTPMGTVVAETGATPTQVALAWLLHHSPVDAARSRGPSRWPTWRRTARRRRCSSRDAQVSALDAVHAAA